MSNPNRIGVGGPHASGAIVSEPVTASPEIVAAAQAAVAAPVPGQGGWTPPPWLPGALGILASVLTAVGEAASMPDHSVPVLVGAAIKALVVGVVAFLGSKSAGPRKA